MWTALTLALVTAGGLALYAGWAMTLAARGVSPWLLAIGAPLLYGAIVFAFTLAYFAIAWAYRAKRPPQAQIGLSPTLRLVGNEYRALLGSARRMIFYRWLIRDPAPMKARAPVLLVHGVLCNAGVWARFSRLLRARGVQPVYTISYGPPLASIDCFADQLAVKIDRILAETGAPSVVAVTHSMGGLVVLAYCRKFGAEKIRRLIALAAPFHGSVHAAYFPGVCLSELRPGSFWLQKLHRRKFAMPPVSSIWSWHDSMVAPQTSCKLKDAQNIALTGVGHNAILADPGAFARAAALIAAEQARAERTIDAAPETALTSESPASTAQTPSARA